MNKKTLLVWIFLISVVWVLAYSAGAKSLQLSGKEINVNHLSSTNNKNQLLPTIRDGMISTLDVWAKNHETRLQVFWATPEYPNLTSEETTYISLLSSKNGNQLTSQMRDGLLAKLTNGMTNHEMRLRALENKSTKTTRTETPKTYHCIGEYSDGKEISYHGKEIQDPIQCMDRRRHTILNPQCCIDDTPAYGTSIHENTCEWATWMIYDLTIAQYVDAAASCLLKDESGPIQPEDITCYYQWCSNPTYKNNPTYCERKQEPIKKSCKDFNQAACTAKPGCSWTIEK